MASWLGEQFNFPVMNGRSEVDMRQGAAACGLKLQPLHAANNEEKLNEVEEERPAHSFVHLWENS